MRATHKTFKWLLWSHQENVSGASDEFIVEGFRVRLLGPTLEVSFEASGTCSPGSAKSLAEKYVKTLAKHLATSLTLITEEEWSQRTSPPFGKMMTVHIDRKDRGRVVNAIKKSTQRTANLRR